MSTVLERLSLLERDVRRIDRELEALRAEVSGVAREEPPAPAPRPAPRPAAAARRPMPPLQKPVPAPAEPLWSRESLLARLESADLLGGRGLALAGGVVTLLGVVFFFALAASNGWIGPVERVLLGAAASAIVFAAGVVAHARYGRLVAAVAAAGAGIAGGYATLLFAAARYELVPPLGALAHAAAIAAVATALSLRWSSEIVAAFGLVGAMAVPAVALLDGDPTAVGTGFVALVFLGAAVVGTWRRWDGLLVAAGAVSVPQLVVLVGDEGEPARARVLAVAAVFGLLYLGAGIARQLSSGERRLDGLASGYVGGNLALTLLTTFWLLDGNDRALGLAAGAAVYLAVAAVLWRRQNELAALGLAAGSALVAVAAAQLLDGPALVVAWAAETALLAWLGRRLADARFQLLGLAYLVLALAYTLVVEAPPDLLFTRHADHVTGVAALLAVGAGAAAYGWVARSWPRPRVSDSMPQLMRELVADVHEQRATLSFGSLAIAALLAADAASLSLLELFARLEIEPSFDWGHVAVTGAWSLVALVLLAGGLAVRARLLEVAGLVTLGAVAASFAFFTVPELPHVSGWAALVLAGAGAAAALVHGLLGGRLAVVTAGAVALGVVASGFAAFRLLDGDGHGYGLLAAAVAHGLLSAAVWRRRDLASFFWTGGAALATLAAALLLEDTWLVLALAGGAVAAALLGRVLPEPRLWLPAAALTGLAGVYALTELAEPDDLVRAAATPADGVPALLLVLGALAALLLCVRPFAPRDELDRRLATQVGPLVRLGRWLLATGGLYAASLAVLGLVEWLSNAPETTELQRGHTAVSALWGVVAFAAVLVGLRRRVRAVRLAGLGLFVLALGKLFLYDLAALSSITRALSFLAVGAVLLLAGFFYQRLASEEVAAVTDRRPVV
jgi:hypothetical protein